MIFLAFCFFLMIATYLTNWTLVLYPFLPLFTYQLFMSTVENYFPFLLLSPSNYACFTKGFHSFKECFSHWREDNAYFSGA